MFKIGEFSRFSRISVKMLRHYDDLGLLHPARVDAETGYRYYSADQLPHLNRILALKDLGFSLEQIAGLLKDDLSNDEFRGMLKLKRAEVQQRIQIEQERLSQISLHLAQLEDSPPENKYDVVLRQVDSGIYATMRRTVTSQDNGIQFMFETVERHVAQHKARAAHPPMTIFHDPDFRADMMDVEVAIPVNNSISVAEQITIREVQGSDTMACVVFTRGYSGSTDALAALMGWIEANNYQPDGALREVYLRFGADEMGYTVPPAYLAQSSDDFVTELQLPVTKGDPNN